MHGLLKHWERIHSKAVMLCIVFAVVAVLPSVGAAQSGGLSPERITISSLFDESWVLRKDIPVFLDLEGVEYTALAYQKEADFRIAFWAELNEGQRFNEMPAVLTFDPIWFLVHGMPVLMDPLTGEEREIDYVFKNDMMIFEVGVSDYPRVLRMHVTSRKLRNRGELTIQDKLKQARTLRWIRPQVDSWSELKDRQIIAQKTIEPIICHGGYEPDSVKTAVIWGNDTTLSGTFELIECSHNRQHPAQQSVVYVGEIRPAGSHIWGGNNYIADFSDFKKEGMYRVRLRLNETVEVTDSNAFVIRKDRYLDLAKKAGGWFYYQRCGMEIPGFHKACHTQDAIIRENGEIVDVTGGWHDAGDYGKWIGPGTVGIWSLLALQEEFGDELAGGTGTPKFLDEAVWEGRYICKGYWDGIFHPGFTPDMEDVCTWLGAPECEPPRILTEEQALAYSTKGPGISWTGAALARLGGAVMPYDPELAERCLEVAADVYDIERQIDLSQPEYEERHTSYLGLQTGLLLTDIELYKVWGDDRYAEDAKLRVSNILAVQDEQGFFYRDEARTSVDPECNNHLFALYEFLRAFPGSRFDADIRDAFRRWAEHTVEHTGLSNFGMVAGETEEGKPWNLRYAYSNRRLGRFAWGLATAALLLDEPKYLETAERNIQWILGFNPTNISMMAGVGHNPSCYHHRYCFIEGHQDGVVPGGVINGIKSGEGMGDPVYLGDTDTKNFVMADVPFDYPVIDTDVWGWTYSYASNEYWARNNACFIMGALQVEKALRVLR